MMKLSNDKYEFIKGEVVAIFERYDVRCIPINGFELAYKMGIKIIPYSSLDAKKRIPIIERCPDGFFMEDLNGNEIIFFNDSMPYERINMTILHEIGHCVLDHTGNSEEEEAEANFFAKYAAAPPPLVHRSKSKCPEDIEFFFGLSHEAAENAYRYYNKWLCYKNVDYTDYEIRLITLFMSA